MTSMTRTTVGVTAGVDTHLHTRVTPVVGRTVRPPADRRTASLEGDAVLRPLRPAKVKLFAPPARIQDGVRVQSPAGV
jgi:hypothetical protein